MTSPTLVPLNATFKRLHNFGHLASIASWDQAAMMPAKGNEARAAAMAELQVLMHQTLTDPSLKALFAEAAAADLPDADKASLVEMQREWALVNRLPQDLVEAQSLASARCEHAWRTQRKANDWQGFLGNFKEVVSLARQEAKFLADATGTTPYEALMDKFEPGMRESAITKLFGDVKTWLPDLITKAIAKQQTETVVEAKGPFPVDQQRALGVEVMGLLGFDFEGGRLDISTHPVLRRRATRCAHHHALQGSHVRAQPDGHHPRDRPCPL
jgi:carboxypeptidase Taq